MSLMAKGSMSPVQSDSERWRELFGVLEQYMATHINPRIEALESLRSVFEMSEEDLAREFEELGGWFDVNMPISVSSKPLALLWRREELMLKNTLVPLILMLRRNFSGLTASWTPLYCHKSAAYTMENLKFQEEIEFLGHSLDDYWKTSRGYLTVDQGHLAQLGYTRLQFLGIVEHEVKKLIPETVVYEGERFLLVANITVPPPRLEAIHRTPLHTSSMTAPASVSGKKSVLLQSVEIPALTQHADGHFLGFDEAPADWWPLDQPLYIEEDIIFTLPRNLGDAAMTEDAGVVLGDAELPIGTAISLGSASAPASNEPIPVERK